MDEWEDKELHSQVNALEMVIMTSNKMWTKFLHF